MVYRSTKRDGFKAVTGPYTHGLKGGLCRRGADYSATVCSPFADPQRHPSIMSRASSKTGQKQLSGWLPRIWWPKSRLSIFVRDVDPGEAIFISLGRSVV